MKHIQFILLVLCLALFSCQEKEQIELNQETIEQVLDQKPIDKQLKSPNQIYSDWSGKVKIEIFYAQSGPSQHNTVTVPIDPDYVLIGGGAWASYSGAGALLTESRPNTSLDTWIAKSKDHHTANIHTLYGYAIGLKLDGISADVLRSYMRVSRRTSGTQSHPNTFATVSSGYKLVGGGAKINWSGFGNLLVHSYPSGSAWYVKGKDHHIPNLASITAYAIGIKEYIPGFGYLDISTSTNQSYGNNYQIASSTTYLPSGWVLACPGGRATFNGFGRLLFMLRPNGNSVQVKSKDHLSPDSGYVYSYAKRIRKRP